MHERRDEGHAAAARLLHLPRTQAPEPYLPLPVAHLAAADQPHQPVLMIGQSGETGAEESVEADRQRREEEERRRHMMFASLHPRRVTVYCQRISWVVAYPSLSIVGRPVSLSL